MEVWHVLFPRYVQCVHAFVARSAQLFDLTISTTHYSVQRSELMRHDVMYVSSYCTTSPRTSYAL